MRQLLTLDPHFRESIVCCTLFSIDAEALWLYHYYHLVALLLEYIHFRVIKSR